MFIWLSTLTFHGLWAQSCLLHEYLSKLSRLLKVDHRGAHLEHFGVFFDILEVLQGWSLALEHIHPCLVFIEALFTCINPQIVSETSFFSILCFSCSKELNCALVLWQGNSLTFRGSKAGLLCDLSDAIYAQGCWMWFMLLECSNS